MDLSVVVVAYDMARELPRTLTTLSRDYQRNAPEYEVIVVDNGSPDPVDESLLDLVPAGRLLRVDPAPPSPARAANIGVREARAPVIGLLNDGARMASPGLLSNALRASRLGPRTVVATPSYHLGREVQMVAAAHGYDQRVEDELLDSVDWRSDGEVLFTISCLAASSARGWFGPMGETNALFLHRPLWDELGGCDEVFARPGGGLVNHDLYRRACEAPGAASVVLIGEGTFHQFHGGASTGGGASRDELWDEYETIRGRTFEPPGPTPTLFGRVPAPALPHLESSVAWLRQDLMRHTGSEDHG